MGTIIFHDRVTQQSAITTRWESFFSLSSSLEQILVLSLRTRLSSKTQWVLFFSPFVPQTLRGERTKGLITENHTKQQNQL